MQCPASGQATATAPEEAALKGDPLAIVRDNDMIALFNFSAGLGPDVRVSATSHLSTKS